MHPPQFNECGLIFSVVYLQWTPPVFHDCSDRAVNNESCVQGDGYDVTALEGCSSRLAFCGLALSRPGGNALGGTRHLPTKIPRPALTP
jgi:hypothetical protein